MIICLVKFKVKKKNFKNLQDLVTKYDVFKIPVFIISLRNEIKKTENSAFEILCNFISTNKIDYSVH